MAFPALQCKSSAENDTDHVNEEIDEKNSEDKIPNATNNAGRSSVANLSFCDQPLPGICLSLVCH